MIFERWALSIKLFINNILYSLRILLFYSGKEQWDEDFKANFNDAKLLSDFVGMLLRLAFLTLSSKFFFLKAFSQENIISRSPFFTCGFLSVGLYFALLIKINGVILNYWLSDLVYWKSKTSRIFIFFLSIFLTSQASYGIYVLINELSLTSSVFQKMNNDNKKNH